MGNAASSLPYSIGKPIATHLNHGWSLHDGQRKSDGTPVAVFIAKKPQLVKTLLVLPQSSSSSSHPSQPSQTTQFSSSSSLNQPTQYSCAAHHFMHCKKLRHPHIVTVIATLDTDNPNDTTTTTTTTAAATAAASTTNSNNHTATSSAASAASSSSNQTGDFIIVTEPCIPFTTWLSQHNPSTEQIIWGLECIVRAISFLHTSALMCHGNLSPESFYVTPAGDVKLWNFALVFAPGNHNTNNPTSTTTTSIPRHFIDYESWMTPQPYRSPERCEGRWDAITAAGVHVMDSYGLGILVAHMFHSQIPIPLVKAVQRLQTTNMKMRPKLLPLLKCPIFDTPYQKLQLQLEQFAVVPVEQKIHFWNTVPPILQAQIVPPTVVLHKLLPLIQQEIETICGNESLRAQEIYRKEGTLYRFLCVGVCVCVCVVKRSSHHLPSSPFFHGNRTTNQNNPSFGHVTTIVLYCRTLFG
jgi:SCY1-like protein 1